MLEVNYQHVLQLDLHGQPQGFLTLQEAATAYASGDVAWTLGEPLCVLRGGFNARSGVQSTIELAPIVAMRSAAPVNLHDACPPLTNAKLWIRDRHTCCWCGSVLPSHRLTREHIVPTSRGGLDVWENTASSCAGCNTRRGNRLASEAGMELLYLPYRPSLYEDLLLRGRTIRGDVHEFIAARLPRHSRLL